MNTMLLHKGAFAILIMILGIGIQAHAGDKDSGRVAMPTIKITKEGKCVEDTDIMRRDHMEFILHQRDKTMHNGIRTRQHSLKNCINCHADPVTNSVRGEDGFCQNCHSYAAVTIDCFGCHSDKRETDTKADLGFHTYSTVPAAAAGTVKLK